MKGTCNASRTVLRPLDSVRVAVLVAILLLSCAKAAQADQYGGNGKNGFGGSIGNGVLTLSDDGTNISGTLTVGGSMNDVLVLYIQAGTGGFADTSGFNDQSDSCRQAISGSSASGRSLLAFASGFHPNYAVALAPAAASVGGVWQLANGGNGSLVYLGSNNLAPLNASGPYTFSFAASLLAMTPGVRSDIQVFGTYVSSTGFRSPEAIAGDLTGVQGWTPFTQTAYAGFTFDADAVRVRLPLGNWTQGALNGAPAPRWYHTAVWTGTEMIVWGGRGTNGYRYLNDGGSYNPAANSWAALPTSGAPAARLYHTAVWTGNDMIVWGGVATNGISLLNDGGRYNPVADSWTALSTTGAPAWRAVHTAVWTGSEMIIWGGEGNVGFLNSGGRYNPAANSWTALPTSGAPTRREYHTAVWTGSEMIVWGGYLLLNGSYICLNTGGRYNPIANTWTPLPTSGAPDARMHHTAVWTGNEMIIWGGYYTSDGTWIYLNSGGRYNPTLNTWSALPTNSAPTARAFHTAAWTGSEMIVWGGQGGDGLTNEGGRFNPAGNSWTAMTTNGAPAVRSSYTAVWTGNQMTVWGGYGNDGLLSDTWCWYPYAPAVRISRSRILNVDVTWPVWHPSLHLCQTTNLAAANWTTVTNGVTQFGSENRVTLSPLSGCQLFRVECP